MTWPFAPLPMFGFDVVMADPPWAFELRSEAGQEKSAQAHYTCMPTAEIAALPVGHLARGDCWLWLWATFPMLQDAFAVMDAWGFRYATGGTWIKRGPSGKLAFGTGYILRGNAEPFLIGKVGNPPICSRSILNVIEAPRGRHSEKPTKAYENAEAAFGPADRADIFSRTSRPGWTAWGDQAGALDNGGTITKRSPAPRVRPATDPNQFSFAEAAE